MHHGHRMAIPPRVSKIMGSSFHRNELITILSLRNWRFAGETLHMGKKGLQYIRRIPTPTWINDTEENLSVPCPA